MRELCERLLAVVSDVQVKQVNKTEQDNSWTTFNTESVEFLTTSGLTVRITVFSPKPLKENA